MLTDKTGTVARLSVFAGGFTLAAVEQVGAGGELADCDVLNLVGALVDKSVVQRVEGEGEYRYRLLDTICGYGVEQLDHSGRSEEYARRHRDLFLHMAQRAGEEWRTGWRRTIGTRTVAWW
ncbi:hypothetical protein [Streptomyces ardesiacus]|uniref:hypothetical protein n=1 Tax=Streptomyces ardesiacus TaxID=285564 RepID=UPI0036E4367B